MWNNNGINRLIFPPKEQIITNVHRLIENT